MEPYGHDYIEPAGGIKWHWSAAMFKSNGEEVINEVSFRTLDNNVNYEIYVNKHGLDNPATPGVPQGEPTASGKMTYAGYHTVYLDNQVELEKDEWFSVIVKLSASSQYGKKYITAVEELSGIPDNVITDAGQSYFAESEEMPTRDKDWVDGEGLKDSNVDTDKVGKLLHGGACIKAFPTPNGPAEILTEYLPAGFVERAYSCRLSSSGLRATWTAEGLPEGLVIEGDKIIGTPKQAGTFTVHLTAENAKGSGTADIQLAIRGSILSQFSGSGLGSSGGGGGCNTAYGLSTALAILAFILIRKSEKN